MVLASIMAMTVARSGARFIHSSSPCVACRVHSQQDRRLRPQHSQGGDIAS